METDKRPWPHLNRTFVSEILSAARIFHDDHVLEERPKRSIEEQASRLILYSVPEVLSRLVAFGDREMSLDVYECTGSALCCAVAKELSELGVLHRIKTDENGNVCGVSILNPDYPR